MVREAGPDETSTDQRRDQEPAERLNYDTTYVQRQSFWTGLGTVL